ncbi:MAG: FKBP-type peptidyl-prolyl cis-trans isomerase [Pseudomonadota bacterium]
MKKAYLATMVTASLVLSACGGNTTTEETEKVEQPAETVELVTDNDKQTYAIGASMALFAKGRFEQQEMLGMETNQEAIIAGFLETIEGNSRFSETELQQFAQEGDAAMRLAQQEFEAKKSEENLEAGRAFLTENATKEGIVVTDSGLQYEVLDEGEGASPNASDVVKVHYEGTLLDGTVFDSSYERGEPIEFALNQVIPGWTEGVQLMKEGGKFKLYIPSELAYGPRATGSITPNSTLTFVVELLEVIVEEEEEVTEE